MDPISDMLIKIKNAQMAKKETVSFGHSKLKFEIAKILSREGFIADVQKKGKKNVKLIEVGLIQDDGGARFSQIRRVSKPSRRVYRGYKEIFSVRKGFGLAIYSTPKGLLTDKEARRDKIGGEVLFEIY